MNGQKLETVTSFKYLGSNITDEGSTPEILSRIAQTTAALTRLKPVWIDKSISLSEDSIEQGTEVNCTEFPYSTWAHVQVNTLKSRTLKSNFSHSGKSKPSKFISMLNAPGFLT